MPLADAQRRGAWHPCPVPRREHCRGRPGSVPVSTAALAPRVCIAVHRNQPLAYRAAGKDSVMIRVRHGASETRALSSRGGPQVDGECAMTNTAITRYMSWALAILIASTAPLHAQVPVDAASDRRPDKYAFFQTFGEPQLPFENLTDVQSVRRNSDRFFESALANCEIGAKGCSADTVYELADRFCQALEFNEAVSWRTSKTDNKLTLHWAICGLKK